MGIIETERLYLDEASTGDVAFFYCLMNSAGWLTYIGDRNIKSSEDAVVYINEKIAKSYADNGFGLYVMKLKECGESVGVCGFVKRDSLPHADLGFAMLPAYESNGYMFEAAKSIIEYGFVQLSFTEILAITFSTNTRSEHLLLKLGFVQTGKMDSGNNQPSTLVFSIKRNSNNNL